MDEPVANERAEGDEMLTSSTATAPTRAFDESPVGPHRLEALANVEPGTTVSFVEPTSASGYIFPATVFATVAGLDPETDLDASLRRRPRRLGHRRLQRARPRSA